VLVEGLSNGGPALSFMQDLISVLICGYRTCLSMGKSLWAGDREVVKRSGRDEPIRVVIHTCMEAVLGLSLYSYLYLKLAKILSFLLSLCLLFNKIGEEGRTGSALK
jgi:hypothetical protein